MQTFFKISLFIFCLYFISCDSSNQNEANTEEVTTNEAATDAQASDRIVEAAYVSATVYAGSIDFTFETKDSDMLVVRESTFEEDGLDIPENMLNDDETIEGPPDANPDLVGATFRIHYNAEGMPLKIELAE